MKPIPNEALAGKLREVEQRAGLGAELATDRAAAVAASTREIEAVAAAEAERLRRALAALEQQRVAAVAATESRAETTRRSRASALMARMFGRENLPALIAEFRAEPTRRGAMAIRTTWDAIDALARAELGEPLTPHVLGALLVDSVIAQPGMAGAVNALAEVSFGGGGSLESLDAFTRATSPGEVQAALEGAEASIVAAARAGAMTPDPRRVELHALRRTNATHRDLMSARGALEAKHAAAEREEFSRSYKAPPTWRELVAERLRQGFAP